MSKKSTTLTLAAGTQIPAGQVMLLTAAQANARRHLLTPVKDWHGADAAEDVRLGFTASLPTFFKARETLGLEGEVDRAVLTAGGVKPPKGTAAAKVKIGRADKTALDAAFAKGKKAGRKEALEEVDAFNKAADAVADAEDVLATAKAGGDAEAIKKAEAGLAAAKAALPSEPQP